MKKKKNTVYLRSVWGQRIDRYRNYNLIASYHNLLEKPDADSIVDDKTWEDLNLDSVYSKIDRNISCIGEQYLYHLLRKYEKNENELKKRSGLYEHLKTDAELREKIQLTLFGLRDTPSYFIPYLLLSESLPNTKYFRLFYLAALAPLISLLFVKLSSYFLLGVIGCLLLNIIIEQTFSKKIYQYFSGFIGLNSLIAAGISISKISNDLNIEEIELLRKRRSLLKSLRKKLSMFVVDKEALDELSRSLLEYLNTFFLFDIIGYYRSVNLLMKNQEEMHEVYKAVAGLDSAISIASYLSGVNYYTTPKFNNTDLFSFDDLYHPSIYDAVSNTINEINDSVLITGSNMSGKTTFIKTVGINCILARTLYFSLARSFSLPKCFVKTSIRRNEEMEEGKSYFWIEIEELKKFIELSEGNNKYLFLIDEIFRGTNTAERLASSTAVLKFLDKKNLVFVTTHDIELQDLLENQYKMFHFSEQVEDGKFFFNYKIKEGPCTSGNAIKLLEIMGYPAAITDEANRLVKELYVNNLSLTRNKT